MIKKLSRSLRPSRPKTRSGQGTTELVLMFVAILVVAAVAAYYLANPPPSTERDYITIEGRIVEVKTGERLVLIWENDDGTFALSFWLTGMSLPIEKDVKLSYHFVDWSSFPFIDNVEVLG